MPKITQIQLDRMKKHRKNNPEFHKKRHRKYYLEHREDTIKKSKAYFLKNRVSVGLTRKKWSNEVIKTWEGFIPLITQCQMCGEDIYFHGNDKKKAIRFDHRHGGIEQIKENPSNWLRRKKRTPENQRIWESCDFGMLCGKCNSRLPTENRIQFKENINKYIK